MRDPIIEKLSRFTADGSGLDRDAILFAAGRASARPNRGWQVATGGLVACQLVTLALLWPRSAIPVSPSVEPGLPMPMAIASLPERTDQAVLGVLSRGLLVSGDVDLPPLTVEGVMIQSDPPLHAYVGSIPAGLE
jgi:hypothetical protein